ncbi:hypothetical protein DEFR109230_14565 [Deinococcus frigens]
MVGLAALLVTGCTAGLQRTPDLFLIPQGYAGWILVEYGVEGVPSLELRNGYRVLPIPVGGILKTSSEQQQGWARDVYKFVDARGKLTDLPQTGWGKGGLIWGASVESGKIGISVAREGQEAITCDIQVSPSFKFFVGTEAQYRQAVETDKSPATPAQRAMQASSRCS